MKFKMIKTQAISSKSMIFESKDALWPFKQYSFSIGSLFQTFSLHDNPSHSLVSIAFTQIIIPIAFA